MALSRIGFWFFVVSSLVVGLISLRILVAPLESVMDHVAHYLPTVPWPLYGHIVLAPLALMLAPFQFWVGLRVARPVLHRWMGRSYALAVLGAGLSSLLLLPQFQGSVWAMVGFFALAVLWIGFTAMGVMQARQGGFAGHRAWMLRSVALTFAAVTLRIYMAPMVANGWTVVETYDVTAWAAWVPNLIAVEWALRARTGRVVAA
jgi:hypothetical protein